MYQHRGQLEIFPQDLYQSLGLHRGPHPAGIISAIQQFSQPFTSGTDNLPTALEINGQVVQPYAIYEGKNASLAGVTATAGSDLVITGGGADPTLFRDVPTGGADKAFKLNEGKYYSSASALNLNGQCLVLEIITKVSPVGIRYIWSNRAAAGSGNGIAIYENGSGIVRVRSKAAGQAEQFNTIFVRNAQDEWLYILFGIDGSRVRTNVNGSTFGSPTTINVTPGDYTGDGIQLAAINGGGMPSNEYLWVGSWTGSSLFDLSTDAAIFDAVAKQRFQKLVGLRAGLAKASDVPLLSARNSLAHLRTCSFGEVVRYHPVGNHWPLIEEVRDARSSNADPDVTTNGFAHSEDLTDASWVKTNVTFGADLAAGSGDTTLTLKAMVPTAVNAVHTLASSLSPANSGTHVFSVYAKAGNKNVLHLQSNHPGLGTDVGIFVDLVTQEQKTYGGIFYTAYVEDVSADFGAGVYRIGFSYSGPGANHAHTISWATAMPTVAASNAAELTYLGNGSTIDGYVGGCMHDFALDALDDYVRTTGAARTLGKRVQGYLSESAATNRLGTAWSNEPTNWSTENVTTSTQTASPSSEAKSIGLVETAATNKHDIYRSIGGAVAAIGTRVTLLAMIRRGGATARRYAFIGVSTGGNNGAYIILDGDTGQFNLQNVGTNTAIDNHLVKDLGDGWFLTAIRAEMLAALQPFAVLGMNAGATYSGTWSYIGDPTTYPDPMLFHLVGGFINAEGWPSPIRCAGADTTRDKTELRYEGNSNVADGESKRTYAIKAVIQSGRSGTLFSANDGGSSNEQIYTTCEPTTGVARVRVVDDTTTIGDVTGTTDLTDSKEHEVRVLLQANRLRLFVDGTEEGSEDTTVSLPTGLDRLEVGMNETSVGHCNALITDLRTWKGLKAT